MIPYSRQTIDHKDIKAVEHVLKSDWLTTGPFLKTFEENFKSYVGAKYAMAVANGTAALHLACLAAGLKQNEELITSPLTFAASANCALYCGAKPIFVDINDQGLMDENKVEEKITSESKIIIPIHYAGFPCNLEKIKKIANKHNLIVIEDACHALGARYKKSRLGDCQYSDMAVFSFHPVKHITTGEGGMITTNSQELYERLLLLRNHGITKENSKFKIQNSKLRGDWYYEMQELGYNYRLTDIQAALGISQLKKIKQFIVKRRKIAAIYNEAFGGNQNIKIIKENKDQLASYHLYPIRVKDEKVRFRLFQFLRQKGIYSQVHYIPIYWHPYYQQLGYKKGICSQVENFYKKEISIPLYPGMTTRDINFITKNILKFFKN